MSHLAHVFELIHQICKMVQMLEGLGSSLEPELGDEAALLIRSGLDELDWLDQLIILPIHEEIGAGLSAHHLVVAKGPIGCVWAVEIKVI